MQSKRAREYESEQDVRRTKARYHESLVCSVCAKLFTSSARLIEHSISHTENRTFVCARCHKAFAHKDALSVHEQSDIRCKRRDPSAAPHVDAPVLAQVVAEETQILSEQSPNTAAAAAEEEVTTSFVLPESQIESIDEDALLFSEFDMAFAAILGENERSSMPRGSAAKKQTPACPHCRMSFESDESVREHVLSKHERERRFGCELCNVRFTRRSALKRHVLQVHRPAESVVENVCDHKDCGKTFTSIAGLSLHKRRVHDGERTIECKECGETFAWSQQLRRHEISRHNKARRFHCAECSSPPFMTRSDLNAHERGVHGKRRYECETCHKQFTQKGSLTRHMKTVHSDKRPFVCEQYCGKAFKTRSDLKKHVRERHEIPRIKSFMSHPDVLAEVLVFN